MVTYERWRARKRGKNRLKPIRNNVVAFNHWQSDRYGPNQWLWHTGISALLGIAVLVHENSFIARSFESQDGVRNRMAAQQEERKCQRDACADARHADDVSL